VAVVSLARTDRWSHIRRRWAGVSLRGDCRRVDVPNGPTCRRTPDESTPEAAIEAADGIAAVIDATGASPTELDAYLDAWAPPDRRSIVQRLRCRPRNAAWMHAEPLLVR
jgi:hypothetical protein